MKILKYSYLMLLSTVLILLNSCSLDEKIKDTPTPATITTESDVKAVIQGMYSRFNDPGMFKFLGHIMLTICADDIYSTSGSSYGPYAQRTFTSANTSPMWDNMYATISNANNLIEVLDQLNLSSTFEKAAYGEAYFIRAFAYYYLVRLYGGVPLRIKATHIDSDFYLPRSSVDETYAQIFSDFKAAADRLPLKAAETGRAAKGAAFALMAQAYLTYGDQLSLQGKNAATHFQNAANYADSVIIQGPYKLLTNYGDLFEINKEAQAYDEVIFGIRFQTDPTARAQPAAGSEYATRFGASNTWGISADGGNGDNTFRVSHWFADFYRKGDYSNGVSSFSPNIDYRNEKAFFQRGYNPNQNGGAGKYYAVYPNGPYVTTPFDPVTNKQEPLDGTINDPLLAKYQDPGGKDGRNNGNDFFIIRLAEIYLIKAEALNELSGPTTAALNAFNMVRLRARTVNSVPNARTVPANLTIATAGSKDNFRMKIFNERGLELVGEGQRWFDLVRMRSPLSAAQTMYEYQFNVILNNSANYPTKLPTGYNLNTKKYTPTAANAVYAPILNVTVPKFLLFPVPSTELIQNPKFGSQNPRW